MWLDRCARPGCLVPDGAQLGLCFFQEGKGWVLYVRVGGGEGVLCPRAGPLVDMGQRLWWSCGMPVNALGSVDVQVSQSWATNRA